MDKKTVSYIFVVAIHLGIALAVFVMPFLSKLYAVLIPIVGGFLVYRTKNRNNEVILVSAYLVGAEVFLRMNAGNFNNEYIKVSVIVFMVIGMFYNGFSSKAILYCFFLLLLIPGALLTVGSDNYFIDFKKVLVFNLSGPLCLGICSIYLFNKEISFQNLQLILLSIGMPVISTTAYLILYNPSVQDVVTGTQSNFETSGGFGPNQVSTILGLGMFVFFTQLILFSKTKFKMIINGILLLFVSYRAIVTFSRGGVITGVAMILILLIVLYFKTKGKNKRKFVFVFLSTMIMGLLIWTYSSVQTSGLIEKRYANQDAKGRAKSDRLGGREAIMNEELSMFINNPVLGVGAGLGKQVRKENSGIEVASHNEVTRMLSEHGLFGVFGLLILILTPLILYFQKPQHLYLLSFFIFWLLTINHAAMRTAAPAFIYALALLTVKLDLPERNKKIAREANL